jgi:hypothetical protein
MDQGGPDNWLVRAAQPQGASGRPRRALGPSQTRSLVSLRDPDKPVVRATRGRAENPATWLQSRKSSRLGFKPLPPVGPGRTQQDSRMKAKSPRERRVFRVVLEETARSGEPQVS